LTAFDYRLTDRHADPEDNNLGTEQLLRLPECFLSFGAFQDLRPDPRPAFERKGYVTFGSFNSIAKLNQDVVETWSAILARVPGARLLLKSKGAGAVVTQRNLRAAFARHGIDGERLILADSIPSEDAHLRFYDNLDIALDPFPYNGVTTTCQALWMGVPVVALCGTHHVARVAYSILSNCGFHDTIALNRDEYVQIAADLALHESKLRTMRTLVHPRLRDSILCQPHRFTRQLEEAFVRVASK
jgi:predicted O-linked N-acetylglucosamine transferase (SPINDLY family)